MITDNEGNEVHLTKESNRIRINMKGKIEIMFDGGIDVKMLREEEPPKKEK